VIFEDINEQKYFVARMTTTKTTANDVLVYVPNLIGYFRVACTIGALFLMIAATEHWVLAITLYLASFVGDLFG
jgi:phosphatidylglycerophosphate synthase